MPPVKKTRKAATAKATVPGKVAKPKRVAKTKFCAEEGCKLPVSSDGYCRLHYLKNFRELKEKARLRAERRLNAYVDRLAKKYPNDYLERIKQGIESEDKFKRTMEELELDEERNENETEREYLERLTNKLKIDE